MTSQRPRRPIPSTSSALAQVNEVPAGIPTQAYADKAKLAQHLHAQGINPLLWTKAHPAIHAEQEQFRRTGQKPRENQFEVDGRLYESSPEIAATPAQGRADFSAYLQARGDPDTRDTSPLESFVEIDKVPLRHPMGQAFVLSDSPESKTVLRNMIKAGIDPRNAHLGDPLPMPTQQRLQRMLKRIPFSDPNPNMPTTGEEPEASDLLYRGADGWIYARNQATREPEEVLKIRTKHAEKRVHQAEGSPRTAANENDPEEED